MKSFSSSSSFSSSPGIVTCDVWRVTRLPLYPLRRVTRHLSLVTILLLSIPLAYVKAQTTQVLFPINSLFGGAAYNKPITIAAANTLITDGQNLWAGTYTIVPASTTNPVVNLYPNTYLMTVAGVVKPARFTVPPSTNVLDVTTLLTSGPLFYFGNNGLANLLAGTNIVFATNYDGSITINWGGNSLLPQVITNASYATNAGTAQYANIAGLAPGRPIPTPGGRSRRGLAARARSVGRLRRTSPPAAR